MVKGMIEPQEIFGKYDTTEWPGRAHCYFPQMFKGWDDNWLYGFGAGHFDAENDVLFYRKNVVTHQYQYVVLLDGAQMLG
jgi:hypothetical protein